MKPKVYALIFFVVSFCLASTTWVGAVEVPKIVEENAPFYEGAKVVQAMETKEFAQVVYTVSEELKKVVKWYKDLMQKEGWNIVMEMNMENNSMLNLAKDNLTLVVNGRADPGGQTTIHLVVEAK